MSEPYSTVIVGLGRIGMGYDYSDRTGRLAITHASAFSQHPGFTLAAGIDPDPSLREQFTRRYDVPAYADWYAVPVALRPDVVALAVPTGMHEAALQAVLDRRPRVVLCEKPLAEDVAVGERMVEEAERSGCVLAINYIRRFEPGVRALKQRLATGEAGAIYKGIVWYSKGLFNNGSHMVDLLHFFFGAATAFHIVNRGRNWDARDPEPDVNIRFGDVEVFFMAGREECFSRVEMELTGTHGLVKYLKGGEVIELWSTRDDPHYPGYRILDAQPESLETDFDRYQWHVVDGLYRYLASGEDLASTGWTALETLRTVHTAASQASMG